MSLSPITQAVPDEEVTLGVKVEGATVEGRTVFFEIQDEEGNTLATVSGPVENGEAKAKWRVDVPLEKCPIDLKVIASLDEVSEESGKLRIVAGNTGNMAGFLTGEEAPAKPPADPGDKEALKDGPVGAGSQAQDASDDGLLPTDEEGGDQSAALWSRLFFDGDRLRILVNVCMFGKPRRLNYDIKAELMQKVDGSWTTKKTYQNELMAKEGGDTWVSLGWKVTSEFVDRSEPAPWRMRFRIEVHSAIGATIVGLNTSETPIIEILTGLVTVKLKDADSVTRDNGKELARQFRDDEVALEFSEPPGTPRVAGTSATGEVVLGTLGTKATLTVRRLSPHAEPIRWHLETKDQKTPGPTLVISTDGPSQSVDVTIHGRARSSVWVDPVKFFFEEKTFKFNPKVVLNKPDNTVVLDDITLINIFDITESNGKFEIKRTKFFDVKRVKDIIDLCHSKGIQVMCNLDAIDTTKTQVNFNLLKKLFEEKKEADIRNVVTQIVEQTIIPGFDGFDLDFEDGLTREWSETAHDNIRLFFRLLGRKFAVLNKFVAITGGTQIGRNKEGTLMALDFTPAKGTNGLQPYNLCFEAPNLVFRPMAYDNNINIDGINNNDQLFEEHAKVIDYALRPRPDAKAGSSAATKPNDGAGLHPGQFQIGVKIFGAKGHKGGVIQKPATQLPVACRDVYRPRRVGVIQFAWGRAANETEEAIKRFWKNMQDVDDSLNGPLNGPATIPGATVGQPLQVPMNKTQRDSLFKPFKVEEK